MPDSQAPRLRDEQIQAIQTATSIDIVSLTVEYLRAHAAPAVTQLPGNVLERRVRMAILHGRMQGLTLANALRDYAVEAMERV